MFFWKSMEANEIPDPSIGNKGDYKNDSNSRIIGATILGISGISAIIAGVITSHVAKKKSRELLKDLGKEHVAPVIVESPYALAFRALAWGTVWAVGGCSLIMFGIWKWYGFKNLSDLRTRARKSTKPNNSDERTEFENLSDFLNYLNDMSKVQSKESSTKPLNSRDSS